MFPHLVLPRPQTFFDNILSNACSTDANTTTKELILINGINEAENSDYEHNGNTSSTATATDGIGSSSTDDATNGLNDTAADDDTTTDGVNSPLAVDVLPRRSARSTKTPSYLQDYHCGLLYYDSLPAKVKFPLQDFLSYDRLSSRYKAFSLAVSSTAEPRFYHEAVPFAHWRDAMNSELQAMEDNKTWTVVPLPCTHHSIGCKWVYKIKHKYDGSIERYKARLVAKGYTQQEGLDYIETFSPVAKLVTVKVLLTLVVHYNWPLIQLDVNNAFLHGNLLEEVYMDIPLRYKHGVVVSKGEKMVCKLQKSIYGLKQTSRQWFEKISHALLDFGLEQSKSDYSLFTKGRGDSFVALLVYVDDIIITGSSLTSIEALKSFLDAKFKLKDLGSLRYFLGLELARSSKGIYLSQRQYVLQLLEDMGMLASKAAKLPMDPNLQLRLSDGPFLADPSLYRRLIGRLLYLNVSRPDITFAVHKLSQFVARPCQAHLTAAYTVLRYLKGCIGKGIFIQKSSNLQLRAFSNADWGSCLDTRKSTTGFCIFLGESLVSWKAKK